MSHATARPPLISTLTRDECLTLLCRHNVGRIAYAFHDRVDIEPIHYVYEQGFLYGRTSEGAKLETIAHNRWVAFEVDEVRGPFDWASVVVHGTFARIDAGAPAFAERRAAAHGAALLHDIVPNSLTVGDPVPWRNVLFRVFVDEISGRRSVPGR